MGWFGIVRDDSVTVWFWMPILGLVGTVCGSLGACLGMYGTVWGCVGLFGGTVWDCLRQFGVVLDMFGNVCRLLCPLPTTEHLADY